MLFGIRPQSGSALASLVIAAGVLGVIGAGVASMQENFGRSSIIINRRIDATSLAREATAVIAKNDVCSCQLNRDTNTPRAAYLNLDLSDINRIPDVNLGVLRETCEFSNSNNILAEAGLNVPGTQSRLTVDSVRIRNIRAITSEKFVATLEITFPQNTGLRAISVPFRFSIDPASGTASTRKITNCGVVPNRIITCPSTMELIGPPGAVGAFCIERNPRPVPASWSSADAQCNALQGSSPIGTFGMCHPQMVGVACLYATQSQFNRAVGEMHHNLYANDTSTTFGYSGYGPDCGQATKSQLGPFRCCLFN